MRQWTSKPCNRRWLKAGLKPDFAEVTWRAENPVDLAGDDAQRMQKLLDVLEDLDDTQAVYHNAVLA